MAEGNHTPMEDIDVLDWKKECWKCNNETLVVWPEYGPVPVGDPRGEDDSE